MNRLQKIAWKNLVGTLVCAAVSGIGVGLMVYLNTKGMVGLIPFLTACLVVGLMSYLNNIKVWAKLDEREQKISRKAYILSSHAFVLCLLCSSFTVFFIVGGKGSIPVYFLPALFLSGLFFAQFVYSAIILIQFALEQADEQ
ncbi:MAG: hypothetical protein ACYS9Y_10325 [Planctomycetota bacterium]|jgi:hypothetical protein